MKVSQPRRRVLLGSIMHESNSFNPVATTLQDFEFAGENLAAWSFGSTEVAGFLKEAALHPWDLVPSIYASATPKGPVERVAFERLTSLLTEAIECECGRLDGVLLALHGAMYTNDFPQADEEIVRRVRSAIGPTTPLVVTHDFHANISLKTVALTDVLITYQQNPHLDTQQRGALAARLLGRIMSGDVKPVQFAAKPAVLWNIVFQDTFKEPLLAVTKASVDLERQRDILAASVAGGYQYNDVPHMGPTIIVVTNNRPDLAEREAQRLSDMMLGLKDRIRLDLPDAATAVRNSINSQRFPVALFEPADNVGGGASGDETPILEELLKQRAAGWVVVLYDPKAVEAAKSLGIDGAFDRTVGGWSPGSMSKPIRVTGKVRSLHSGNYLEPAVRHGGRRYWELGHAAVIEADGSTKEDLNLLLLTTERSSPNSLHQLISCGIYPERQRIIVVKGTIAPRAAYETVAAEIVLVNTAGQTAVDPRLFHYRRARQEFFV